MTASQAQIATRNLLTMQKAIEANDRDKFQEALNSTSSNLFIGNAEFSQYAISIYAQALHKFIGEMK